MTHQEAVSWKLPEGKLRYPQYSLAALKNAAALTTLDSDTTGAWQEKARARRGSPFLRHVPPEPLLTGLNVAPAGKGGIFTGRIFVIAGKKGGFSVERQ